jgi:hypothetical protein
VNAGFIVMGGGRTVFHFASEATISFLLRRQVKCWFVLDRDEKDDTEVQLMKEKLQGNAELCVLNKREIENYLVVSRALSEYIGRRLRDEKKQNNAQVPSVEQVKKDIETCV